MNTLYRNGSPTTATTSHGRWKGVLLWFGSWLALAVGLFAMALGGYALFLKVKSAPENQVMVSGNLSPIQLKQLKSVLSQVENTNYFTADLATIRDRVLMLSWVDRVVVSRQWPYGLNVRVLPRHAIAQWGSGRLLSDRGEIFVEAQPQARNNLPMLHGPVQYSKEMMQQYHQVNQWFLPLGIKLKQLHLTERMTWYFEFNNGLRLIVDQKQPQTKLQNLSLLATTDLAGVWPAIQKIDLRYQNGMAIDWRNNRKPNIAQGQFLVPKVGANSVDNLNNLTKNNSLDTVTNDASKN